MVLGCLQETYRSIVLPYDDEETPLKLMGKKMLPIFEDADQKLSNESLDIIKKLDSENRLDHSELDERLYELNPLLDNLGKDIHSLAMPYWMWTPEFDQSSRSYFQKKKEVKRGPFHLLVQNKQEFLKSLDENLEILERQLHPFYQSDHLRMDDVLIASHLWGMYIVPEFQFSPKLHQYLQNIAQTCKFNYHQDFWE